jgi:hypothetical protein
MKNNNIKRNFWISVLVLATIACIVLCLPNIELYTGINMPFIQIDPMHFNVYGYEVPNQRQAGFMMLSGVLMMAPAGLIPLAINKLRE